MYQVDSLVLNTIFDLNTVSLFRCFVLRLFNNLQYIHTVLGQTFTPYTSKSLILQVIDMDQWVAR